MNGSSQFKLSCSLEGHAQDVKALVAIDLNRFASASRDTKVIIWAREGRTFQQTGIFHGHSHFVNSLAYLANKDGSGLVISGGSDKTILAWDPKSLKVSFELKGHTENVCSLATSENGEIISGSWDKTARVWKNGKCVHTLAGHQFAVWGVLLLSDGSADKTIKIWEYGIEKRTIVGHSDVVRSLISIPGLGFASCSNDGSVRVWDYNGSGIYELYGHTAFIYSLSLLPTGEILSCGEDRSVRVWQGQDQIQTIFLPCVSVWSVIGLESGDLVVGGSDCIVRVFTRDASKYASPDELAVFESSLAAAAIPSNQIGDMKTDDLQGIEGLGEAGTKEGELKMIKIGGKVDAYQWSSADRNWIKIGEVMNAVGSTRKQVYQGKEYDYVFNVDIQEGAPPLKLPFNTDQNPFQAAQDFIIQHELPQSYLEQIANFIIKNAQNVTLGATNAPTVSDPFTGSARYIAGNNKQLRKSKLIPQREFTYFKVINAAAASKKIKELNNELAKSDPSMQLTIEELSILDGIVTSIEKNSIIESIGPKENSLLQKLVFKWPAATAFPGIDLMRVVATGNNDFPGTSVTEFVTSFSAFLTAESAEKTIFTNAMLISRLFANMFGTINSKNIQDGLVNILNYQIDDEVLLRLLVGVGTLLQNQPAIKRLSQFAMLKDTLLKQTPSGEEQKIAHENIQLLSV